MASIRWIGFLAVLVVACGTSESGTSPSGSGGHTAGGTSGAGTGGGGASNDGGRSGAGGGNSAGAGNGAGTAGSGGSSAGSSSGGSSAGTSSGPPATDSLRYACNQYVRAACERLAECTGGRTTCTDLPECPDFLFSEGSSRTRESVLACADVYRSQSCDEVLARVPPACATDGTLPTGSACMFNSQCAGECIADWASCGECAPRAELDGACGEEMGCQPTQSCEGGQCVDNPPDLYPEYLPGAECENACIEGYVCARATADAPATCLPEPATGKPCHYEEFDDGAGSEGRCGEGAYCDAEFKCEPLPEQGEPCAPDVPAQPRCRFSACENGVCPVVDNPGVPCKSNELTCRGLTRCLCPKENLSCTERTCVYERQEAEACTGPNDRCVDGTVCTSDVCVATDELTLAARCN